VHIDAGSLYFVATPDTSKIASRSSAADGVVVSELSAPATIQSTVTVVNGGGRDASVTVTVRVLDSNDVVVASTTSTAGSVVPSGGTAIVVPPVRQIVNASLWTVQTPHLYNVVCSIVDTQTGQVLDYVNTTIGVRSATWKVDTGFHLNGENVKIRGFCNHDDFTAVGMALPDRIWLLRAMQQRGVGANAWRTSHNNYRGSVYDIADATGTLIYDENRDLRASAVGAMAKMLKAHRNHPSIVAYSLCNEGECNWGKNATGKTAGTSWKHNRTIFGMFRNITKELDPTRAISANMWAEYGPGSLTDFLDVQGISHAPLSEIQQITQLAQKRPLIASECCSCQSERGFDQGTLPPTGRPSNLTAGKDYPSFNGDCLQQQVNTTDSLPYVAGSMIWTFGDYIGESLVWCSRFGWVPKGRCAMVCCVVAEQRKPVVGCKPSATPTRSHVVHC
jgi:beta-galactosidase/beta-glucuronidase